MRFQRLFFVAPPPVACRPGKPRPYRSPRSLASAYTRKESDDQSLSKLANQAGIKKMFSRACVKALRAGLCSFRAR